MAASASNAKQDEALNKDIGWEYGKLVDPTNLNQTRCDLCGKQMYGGVYRLKHHIAGTRKDVTACEKASKEDRLRVRDALKMKKKAKIVKATRKSTRKSKVPARMKTDALKVKMKKKLELKQPQKESCDVIIIDDDELLDPKLESRDPVPVADSVEKLSSPQSDVTCVQGYKVKQSNAKILKAILKKHGNIAAECLFKTDSVQSTILEVVCEVVRQIQTSNVNDKMEELERRLSDAEAANVNVAWLRAHLEAINKRKETGKKCTLLKGIKENTALVKRAARKDLRERREELVVAQQRFITAERCVGVLHLVEKNLSDHILDSESELDSWVNHSVV